MRSQLRALVFGAVFIVVAIALIVEPPGTVGAIGYAVVLLVMLTLLWRELRLTR